MTLWTDNYRDSFSRNIGVVSCEEQDQLLNATVGVAGLGGIGGATFLCLVRMGVGSFHIADIDSFSIANLNRQVGSNHAAIGRSKIDVMKEAALKINPDVNIKTFPQGITRDTVSDFVSGVDAIADCIDYFSLSPRELLLDEAEGQGAPVCLTAPLGFSSAMLSFTDHSMGYKEYFDFRPDDDPFEKLLRFTIGLVPARLHLGYMSFPKERLIEMETGPSIASSVYVGGGFLSAEVLFAITKRRNLFAAPYYTQLDLLRGIHVRRRLLWGNRGPLQRLALWLARREYGPARDAFLKFIR